MGGPASLTAAIRQELANRPFDPVRERQLVLAEFSGMLRSGGSLHRVGDDQLDLSVTTFDPTVARRAFRLAKGLTGRAPEVASRTGRPAGLLFRVRVAEAGDLGTHDDLWSTPRWVMGRRQHLGAFLRGALLVRGSVSNPRAAIHAELSFSQAALAHDVAEAMRRTWAVNVVIDDLRHRVVLKSTSAVGALLVEVGAMQGFLAFDRGRLDRDLRRQASRLANADAANLARSTLAARRQIEAIHVVIGTEHWEGLDDDHQRTALARMANPALSLAELGALLDPVVSKATIHRRLARVEGLTARSRTTDAGRS